MPALMAKRASSERCAIRRELHRRRKLAAAPKGGIINKAASVQSKPSSAHVTEKPSSLHAPALVAAYAPTATGEVTKRRCTAPPLILTPASAWMPPAAPSGAATMETSTQQTRSRAEHVKKMPSSSISVKKGMTVKVRTRAGILPTGHCLLLWLAARVVSDAADDDGFLDVLYNGNFPRDDPSRTVRVAMHDVRSMPAMAEI
ncbi:hypothetical protein VPH35_100943 [Triticum aestivum]